MTAAATSLQETMITGACFAKAEGKMGVDAKFASDVKNLLSRQNVTSHVTILSMGVIPSIISNEISSTVERLTKFGPEENTRSVMAIQTATESEQQTVKQMAEASRTGEQV